jgi:SAM-dependent methyltransferase
VDDLATLLNRAEFPRSAKYDHAWMLENQMGPNALWLCEWLCQALRLEPGARVLDLGCGRAMTSIFLAKEYGARVWAADLWMSPDHNWRRALDAGVAHLVSPMRVEAHALPFAQEFFDAIVSIDAYHYFGTDELYLSYLTRFLRAGGHLGIVVPGLSHDVGREPPRHLTEPQSNGKRFWEDECWSFRTAEWWSGLWGRCGKVADVRADLQPDGWRHWRDFERAMEITGTSPFPSYAEALDADAGRHLGFVRVLATRTGTTGLNYYTAGLGAQVGIDT